MNLSCQKKFNKTPWWDALSELNYTIPGQVKNFLVACRTYTGEFREKITIIIKGSKSHAGSGVWIDSFALYMLRYCNELVINCYDTSEIPGSTIKIYNILGQDRQYTIIRFNEYYYGDASECTVLIDDAYLGGTIKMEPKSEFWSLKDHSGNLPPFLHSYEGRAFSHLPRANDNVSPCPCSICRVISTIVITYGEFCLLKSLSIFFGAASCHLIQYSDAIKAKGVMFKMLHSSSHVSISSSVDVRSLLALCDEIPMEVIGSNKVTLGNGVIEKNLIVHSVGIIKDSVNERCDILDGARVIFIDVLPSILCQTKILPYSKTYVDSVNYHVFSSSAHRALAQGAARWIWTHDINVIGYNRTGFEWKGFFQHERVQQVDAFITQYSLVSGEDVTDIDDISWTVYVPGFYKISKRQAQLLGVDVIVGPNISDVRFEVLPPLLPFRSVNGKNCSIHPLWAYVIDINSSDIKVVDYPLLSESQFMQYTIDNFGVVFITLSRKECWWEEIGNGICFPKCKGHQHFFRHKLDTSLVGDWYPPSILWDKNLIEKTFIKDLSIDGDVELNPGYDGVYHFPAYLLPCGGIKILYQGGYLISNAGDWNLIPCDPVGGLNFCDLICRTVCGKMLLYSRGEAPIELFDDNNII